MTSREASNAVTDTPRHLGKYNVDLFRTARLHPADDAALLLLAEVDRAVSEVKQSSLRDRKERHAAYDALTNLAERIGAARGGERPALRGLAHRLVHLRKGEQPGSGLSGEGYRNAYWTGVLMVRAGLAGGLLAGVRAPVGPPPRLGGRSGVREISEADVAKAVSAEGSEMEWDGERMVGGGAKVAGWEGWSLRSGYGMRPDERRGEGGGAHAVAEGAGYDTRCVDTSCENPNTSSLQQLD